MNVKKCKILGSQILVVLTLNACLESQSRLSLPASVAVHSKNRVLRNERQIVQNIKKNPEVLDASTLTSSDSSPPIVLQDPSDIKSIKILPIPINLTVGQSPIKLQAEITFHSEKVEITDQVIWESSDPSVASITGDLVSFLKIGESQLSVKPIGKNDISSTIKLIITESGSQVIVEKNDSSVTPDSSQTPTIQEPTVSSFGTDVTLVYPYGIAVYDEKDSNDLIINTHVYFTDRDAHTVMKLINGVVTTFAGTNEAGFVDGSGSAARFDKPMGLDVDKDGNVYVADSNNHRIRKITPTGVVSTIAGATTNGFVDSSSILSASFNNPTDVVINSDGIIYVVDQGNHSIRRISIPDLDSQVVKSSDTVFDLNQSLKLQTDIVSGTFTVNSQNVTFTVDDSISDIFSKIAAATGVVTGVLEGEKSGDQKIKLSTSNATAINMANGTSNFPTVIKIEGNSTSTSRTSSDSINSFVRTLAGKNQGYHDSSGINAEFSFPSGITIDKNGFLYVSDTFNQRIRKITPGGVVSTFAGQAASGFKDETLELALFNSPLGLNISSNGDLFIADQNNHRIRKINSDQVTTFAGRSDPGFVDGELSKALFNRVSDIAISAKGEIFVVDSINSKIRKISVSDNTISTTDNTEKSDIEFTVELSTLNFQLNGAAIPFNGRVINNTDQLKQNVSLKATIIQNDIEYPAGNSLVTNKVSLSDRGSIAPNANIELDSQFHTINPTATGLLIGSATLKIELIQSTDLQVKVLDSQSYDIGLSL